MEGRKAGGTGDKQDGNSENEDDDVFERFYGIDVDPAVRCNFLFLSVRTRGKTSRRLYTVIMCMPVIRVKCINIFAFPHQYPESLRRPLYPMEIQVIVVSLPVCFLGEYP